jgi:hypothetical protein
LHIPLNYRSRGFKKRVRTSDMRLLITFAVTKRFSCQITTIISKGTMALFDDELFPLEECLNGL